MDCFALGGFLLGQDDVGVLISKHEALMEKWNLSGPLHSTKIRGKRGHFAWLGLDSGREAEFLTDLEKMVLELPVIGIACTIDRPGYVARYAEAYEQPWRLCKTAFAILIERSVRFVERKGGWLEVFFEQSGRREDRDLLGYAKALKSEGMPFQGPNAQQYESLSPEVFSDRIVGEPQRITKKVPMAQIADLVLYPIAKGGYDAAYGPYRKLMDHGRIIDAILPADDRARFGCKYSCFDGQK